MPGERSVADKAGAGEGSETPACGRDHLIHRKRSPFPYEGKDLMPVKLGVTFPAGRKRRAKRCRERRRGEAHRRRGVGWRGSPLRTDSRRGQRLSTDTVPSPAPARSAGLRFAVRPLSKAMNVGRDHLIPRKRSPFPEKTEWRVKSGEWR